MRKLILFCLLLLAVGIPHRLLAQGPKVAILYATNDTWGEDVRSKVAATGLFSTVDKFNIGNSVPSLATLQQYKAVLAFTDGGAMTGNGDNIGDYIEWGGGVVTATFVNASVPIAGKLNTSTYQVLVPQSQTQGTQMTLGTVPLPNHPIMKGVTTFSGGSSSYRSTSTTLTSGSYIIANYANGSPFIMAKENVGAKKARRAELNFYPTSSTMRSDFWDASTDGAKIMGNALLWTIGGEPTQMALSPETIDFGSDYPGNTITRCATIIGKGPATLTVNSVSLSGSPDFVIISGGTKANDTLQINQSRDICIQFTPGGLGLRTATLTVASNGQDSGTQTIDLRGIGSAPTVDIPTVGQMRKTHVRLRDSAFTCITVRSTGSGPVRIDSVRVRGTDASSYYIKSYPESVPQGEARDICVGFRPTFEGRTDAQIVVYTNSFNLRQATIPFYGVGTLGRFVMTPSTLNFDSVDMGDSVCQQVMISNPGTDTMRIFSNYVTFTDADFTFTPITAADSVIRPNESVPFNVCFRPVRNGTRVARYNFFTDIPLTFDDVPQDTSQFTLEIIGVGVPIGRISMTNPPFPSSAIGEEVCLTDTISNGGLSPVTITSANLVGIHAADFTMSGLAFPITLQPGEKRVITLCLTASAQGARTADLVFATSSEGKQGDALFALTGTGLEDCATATPLSLFDGITMVGDRDTAMVTITNCGELTRGYAASILAGSNGYKILGPTSGDNIPPAGTTTFSVEYMPTAMGASAGTLQITGGPEAINVILNGTGGAVVAAATGNGSTVMRGECEEFEITLTNNGNVDWTPGNAAITGTNAGDYTIVSGVTPSTIVPGGTGTMRVRFCPTAIGNRNASLSFPEGVPAATTGAFPYNLTGSGIASSVAMVSEMKGYRLGQSYPNPAKLAASVSISLPYSSEVRVDIVDQTGHVLRTVSGRYPQGESEVDFDLSTLPSGTYFYILSNDEVRLARQLTIVK